MNSRLFDLSARVGDSWCDLANSLHISTYEVERIQLEVHTKKEQAYAMLCNWQSKLGDNANVETVITEIKRIEEKKKAEAFESKIIDTNFLKINH